MLADIGMVVMLRQTGGPLLESKPRQRIVVVATAGTETPLPDRLSPTFLPDGPTGLQKLAASALGSVPSVHERLAALGAVLQVDSDAQQLVDSLVTEASAAKITTRRLLPRRSV